MNEQAPSATLCRPATTEPSVYCCGGDFMTTEAIANIALDSGRSAVSSLAVTCFGCLFFTDDGVTNAGDANSEIQAGTGEPPTAILMDAEVGSATVVNAPLSQSSSLVCYFTHTWWKPADTLHLMPFVKSTVSHSRDVGAEPTVCNNLSAWRNIQRNLVGLTVLGTNGARGIGNSESDGHVGESPTALTNQRKPARKRRAAGTSNVRIQMPHLTRVDNPPLSSI